MRPESRRRRNKSHRCRIEFIDCKRALEHHLIGAGFGAAGLARAW